MESVVRTPKMTGTVGGQDAEDDGDVALQTDVGYTLGGLIGDHIEVRCSPADHGSEADYGVVLAGKGHLPGHKRNLECSWHPGHLEILPRTSVTQERVLRPAKQLGSDKFVETGRYDAYPLAAATMPILWPAADRLPSITFMVDFVFIVFYFYLKCSFCSKWRRWPIFLYLVYM